MSAERLKLTTYFGERDRTAEGHLLADALLDLYGARKLHTSVLLRGIGGFGLTHRLRTDQLLSLSEDLPVLSIAIDRPDRIEAVLADVLGLQRRGLVTLERARGLTGDTASAVASPDSKLTVAIGRRERIGRRPAFLAVTELFREHELAGATALLGVDGTRAGSRRRARFFAANADVPMLILAVGPDARVQSAADAIAAGLSEPTLIRERIAVCKRDGVLHAPPEPVRERDEHGLAIWQKLTVHSFEHDRHDGLPLHRAIVSQLRSQGVAGATTLRGVWGFHGEHPPRGEAWLARQRRAPVLTVVLDTPDRIQRAFATIDALTARTGLVTVEAVPAAQAMSAEVVRGGIRLARTRPG
ncbi:DUF190 domain-containing protein [Conexibacter sp. DBS9H8]|uniref:DUF190 domain-containing protein n=1 Tax=Conexibacter sp. DBS9H8 TaxID=2937801 RepID=UPI00201010A8|nr:DUF190 domain-containing protein [Conexibacter sp. DBS9H8]